jgi:hypothetical protein
MLPEFMLPEPPGFGFNCSGLSLGRGVAGAFGSALASFFFKSSGFVIFGGAHGLFALG